jgi:hypothetical protein
MLDKYILDENHNPVVCDDPLEWAKCFENDRRIVAQTKGTVKVQGQNVGQITVSTVFLGLDHNFSADGPPLLFETMVFGGPLDRAQERCATWDGAKQMHEKWCEKVKLAIKDLEFE